MGIDFFGAAQALMLGDSKVADKDKNCMQCSISIALLNVVRSCVFGRDPFTVFLDPLSPLPPSLPRSRVVTKMSVPLSSFLLCLPPLPPFPGSKNGFFLFPRRRRRRTVRLHVFLRRRRGRPFFPVCARLGRCYLRIWDSIFGGTFLPRAPSANFDFCKLSPEF